MLLTELNDKRNQCVQTEACHSFIVCFMGLTISRQACTITLVNVVSSVVW